MRALHRPRGYLPDREAHGLAGFASLPRMSISAEVGIPDAAVPAILDQNATGSCTGQGTSNAIAIWATVHGVDLLGEVPSPKALYTMGRAKMRSADYAGHDPVSFPALQDEGCEPAMVIRAAAEHGIVPMAPTGSVRDDCYPETINDEIDTSTLIRADGLRMLGPSRITSPVGGSLSNDLHSALGALCPVALALCASDDAFQSYSGGVLDGECYYPADHWVCAIRCREGRTGREYRIVNSWGHGWGDSGMIWVSERWLFGSISDATVFAKLEIVA